MITPRKFYMGEPSEYVPDHFSFSLTCDTTLIDFVSSLPMVNSILPLPSDSTWWVYIDPRYDYEEAWLWVYEELERQTQRIDLADNWADAINGLELDDN